MYKKSSYLQQTGIIQIREQTFFGFQKAEDGGTIIKRIAVLSDLSMKIFVDKNLIPFCEYVSY